MSQKLLFSVVLIFIYQAVFSQITGKIIDDQDSSPLEYATVAIYNQEDNSLVTGVITNADGSFVIENIKSGLYYLEASFMGYTSKNVENISITKRNENLDLGILKLVLGSALNEIVVNAERSTLVNKIDRQVFDSSKFQNSQGGNAVDVIKNLPSVTVDGQGEISVRGSQGFAVLINGKPTQDRKSVV